MNNLKKKTLLEINDTLCSICMNKFIINDEVIELSCNHEFHEECIKIYLKEYNCKCPLCRIDIEENNHKYNL